MMMAEITKGWVVINMNHPTTKSKFLVGSTFRRTRKEAIKEFVDGSGSPWKYWKEKYNYQVVKASQTIQVAEK